MGAYDQPTRLCPYCGLPTECDWVDVGVGLIQCGPYHCYECGASEMGREQFEPGCIATDEEREAGWYKDGMISPYANTFNGHPVGHKMAKDLYGAGLLDKKRGE